MKPVAGNSGMVREINRERIAAALRDSGQATIAAIARTTGLSVATCSNLVGALVRSGEVVELHAESSGGRPARLYAYNVNNTLVASLLLRMSKKKRELRFSIRNRNGESFDDGLKIFETVTVEGLGEIILALAKRHPALKAVALSVPGVVHGGEIEFCDIPEIAGIHIEQRLAQITGLNVITENDMNFAAIGYYSAHREDVATALAYIASPLEEWPGMGLIVNGALIKGKSNFAGEVSFLPVKGLNRNKNKGASWQTKVKTSTPSALASEMAAITASVVTIINPDVVVIAGIGTDSKTHDAIVQRCLTWIPESHLPAIILREDFGDDSLTGMTATAFNTLAPSINLVEKGRLRFDQGL